MANDRSGGRGLHRALWVLGTALLLVALGGVLDAVVRSVAESRLAADLRSSSSADRVTVSLHSTPFLLRLVAAGSVAGVAVSAEQVPTGSLTLERVDVSANGVLVDRGALLFDQRLHVLSIASADITAVVTPAELSSLLGRPVEIAGGSVRVQLGGRWVTLTLTVEQGHLLALDAGGARLASVDLATTGLLPSCPLVVATEASRVTLSCHLEPVPESLLATLSDVS